MKVKRNTKIYSSKHRRGRRRRNPLLAILTVLACALLVFVGWSIAGPLQKLFTGQLVLSHPSSSTAASSAESSSSKASSSGSSSSAAAGSTELHGLYLPGSFLTDSASLDSLIASCKTAGINTVVIDLKDENGKLYFNSPTASALKLVGTPVPDAAAAAAKLKANGIEPAARICCVTDSPAAYAIRDAAIKYSGNHSWLWLDASKKAWLNPYSAQASQYIASLAKEAVGMGYKTIYLDNVQFPTTDNLMWFGDNTASTKEQALTGFVGSVAQAVTQAGGKTSVMMPGNVSIGHGIAVTGQDQSIYSYRSDLLSPMLCPSLLGGGSVQVGTGNTISNPDLAPGETVSAVSAYLKTQATGTLLKSTVPFIQAFTNTNLAGGNKQYTAADINGEISALKANGISSFILYNPTGVYSLSGVNVK